MRSHDNEKGFALILLIGITAALAIFAATMVMMLANQQWGTAKERSAKTALYYSEAALNSAATALESDNSWLTTPFTTTSDQTEMNTNYGSISGAPVVTYLVYDNQSPVNYTVNWDANGDGAVWVQTTTTYVNRTTTVRELVKSQKSSSVLPYAAAWTDTDMTLNNTSNIYGVNLDGTPDTSGAPYATTVMCGGDFTGNSSTTLASPADSTHTQSLGLQVNGNVTTPGHNFNPVKGGVGMLSDYFDQAHQAALMNLAQTAMSSSSSLFDLSPPTVCTTSTALLAAMTYNSTTKTYTASGDLEYNNTSTTLTLNTAGTTYNFQKLYVNGALTLSGNVTVSCTSLYVNGAFTESGATSAMTDQFGPVYCTGTITWKGGTTSTAPLVTIKTTSPTTTTVSGTVMASPTVAGPMFAKILSIDGDSSTNSSYDGSSGAWNITLGYIWVDGDAGTGDVAVNFSGPVGHRLTALLPGAGHDGADLLERPRQLRLADESDGLLHAVRQRRPLLQHLRVGEHRHVHRPHDPLRGRHRDHGLQLGPQRRRRGPGRHARGYRHHHVGQRRHLLQPDGHQQHRPRLHHDDHHSAGPGLVAAAQGDLTVERRRDADRQT